VTVLLERSSDGSPATGLVASDVLADLKKAGSSSFVSKALVDPAQASAQIGSGGNGTVTVSVDTAGEGGNSWTVEVEVPTGTQGLVANLLGQDIVVELAVNAGVPDPVQNTATLVAAAISLLGGVTAQASGTGADSLSGAEGPTTFTGGDDGNFREIASGTYAIALDATETDTEGSLDVRVSGALIRTTLITAWVATSAPDNPIATNPPPMSSVFGFIYASDGDPVQGAAVSARILSQPTVLHPQEEGMALTTELVTTKTDATGFFNLPLVAGAQVDVFISAAGYRRTVTVPTTPTNLFDIP